MMSSNTKQVDGYLNHIQINIQVLASIMACKCLEYVGIAHTKQMHRAITIWSCRCRCPPRWQTPRVRWSCHCGNHPTLLTWRFLPKSGLGRLSSCLIMHLASASKIFIVFPRTIQMGMRHKSYSTISKPMTSGKLTQLWNMAHLQLIYLSKW